MTGLNAQQTVGVFKYEPQAFEGYTLLAPLASRNTYLIDNCGRVLHTWTGSYEPRNSVTLQPDGLLLRTGRMPNGNFPAAGSGGYIERLDWNSNVVWSYVYSTPSVQQHHDICALPNGNTLLLAWESKSPAEALAAGRDPNTVTNALWPEHIVELQPVNQLVTNIVWEWHLWDHLIQDFDPNMDNYGVVADHPELVDINYHDPNIGPVGYADWIHANTVAYDPVHDQIVISSRHLNEFWVIDHSTTTAEAAGHTGGDQGKGGDLLYRWGNPQTYQRGDSSDQQLWGQHDVHWIPAWHPQGGKFITFNNGGTRPAGTYSTVDIISSPVNSDGSYPPLTIGQPHGPLNPDWTWAANPPTSFYSQNISGARSLYNGNILACEGTPGRLIELTPAGDIVWEYINPVGSAGPVAQGSPVATNMVFRAEKYAPSYSGFGGRTFIPGDRLELNPLPLPTNCLPTGIRETQENRELKAGFTSTRQHLSIEGPSPGTIITIYDLQGRTIWQGTMGLEKLEVDTKAWKQGMYIIRNEGQTHRIIKNH